jgi:hypothetical protein
MTVAVWIARSERDDGMCDEALQFANDEFSEMLSEALLARDFEACESLRDGPIVDHLPQLLAAYDQLEDWAVKDLIVHLVQDCSDERLSETMRDALNSPTPDTRAIAVCHLESHDGSLFEAFLVNGFVDAILVERAVKRHQQD